MVGQYRNLYLFLRHGHSLANEQNIIISDPGTGTTGYGLSRLGNEQLSGLLDSWQWPEPTQILCSDFLRTEQTAALVSKKFDVPVAKDSRLRERRFGQFEGLSAQQYQVVWDYDARDPAHTYGDVESLESVAARMTQCIEDLEQAYCDETILLVSHGDPIQIIVTALQRRPLSQHRDHLTLRPAGVVIHH